MVLRWRIIQETGFICTSQYRPTYQIGVSPAVQPVSSGLRHKPARLLLLLYYIILYQAEYNIYIL